MASVSSQKVLFYDRNEIETECKQSTMSLLETRIRWTRRFQFVLERKLWWKRKYEMSQEIEDNVRELILPISRPATLL